MRLEPGAIGALGARLPRGQRGDLGDQRQDDDRRDGRRRSSPARASQLVHNRAGANMAGGVATTLLDAAGRGGEIDGELGLFEVDELWLAPRRAELSPAGDPARQPVPRPARPLRRARGDRRQLARAARRRARRRASSTPMTRCSPTSAASATADVALLRRRGRLARAPGHGARRRRQALPQLRRPLHLRRRLPRPPRPLPLPELRRARARSRRSSPSDVALEGRARASFTLTTPAGSAEVRSPCPGSTTSTTRSPPPRWRARWSVPARDDRRRARRRPGRLSAAPRALRLADRPANGAPRRERELRILLVKNPAGANEVLRTLAARARRARPARRPQRPDRRRPRRLVDLGRRLRAARRPRRRRRPAAARAPPTSRRGSSTRASSPTRIASSPTSPARARRGALAPGDAGRPLYALPTYTAMLALRELLVARGEAASAWS